MQVGDYAGAGGGIEETAGGEDAERGWAAEYGEAGGGEGEGRGWGRGGAGRGGGCLRTVLCEAGAEGLGDLIGGLGGGICLCRRAEIGRVLGDACAGREGSGLAWPATAGGQEQEEADQNQGIAGGNCRG